MSEGPDQDEDVELGSVKRADFQLVIRGLECLKKELLDAAGGYAQKKLSRKTGSLEELVVQGQERLAQVERVNELQRQWSHLIGRHKP